MKKKARKKRVLLNARNRKRETRRRHVLALYRQGYSCNRIAVKLNANPHTIASDLHVMGRHVKTQKTKAKRNAALIKDRCEGKTITALAKKYKISEDRVHEIIDNYNKVAENPVPDFKTLREIRLKNQLPKPKRKKFPLVTTITGASEKAKARRKKYVEARLAGIVGMYNNGSTLKMIAKQCNVTESRVRQLLKKAKVLKITNDLKKPKVKLRSFKTTNTLLDTKKTKSAEKTKNIKTIKNTKTTKSTKTLKSTKTTKSIKIRKSAKK
jgi:Mor family transcriptional regulator